VTAPHASTAESPLPVRTVARLIGEWVARLGRVWVEGQITELSRRPRSGTVFLVLRDPVADVSLRLTCAGPVYEAALPPLREGSRVVVWAKPEVYLNRGVLSLTAFEIRPLGVGELLVRLERLKAVLAAEGLFATDRKRPLPFLPRAVGLVCGRSSAAEQDVVENATRRWPVVRFRVREVAVQGPYAVQEVRDAVRSLDADAQVDVIVLARGGGSVEDLLPFSDESLIRAVAACRTPVVSAIGHEQDVPLVDLVADARASTPTDAGKLVVPDVAEELLRITGLRDRARRHVIGRLRHEQDRLDALRTRPVLAEPQREVDRRVEEVQALLGRVRGCLARTLDTAAASVTHLEVTLTAVSPAGTLRRGYAVVQRQDGLVVRSPREVCPGSRLRLRLADGEVPAEVTRSLG
jgi:exodeoxyribonuclease VII large subunit